MGHANAKPGGCDRRRVGRRLRRVLGWTLVVLAVGVTGLSVWSQGRDGTVGAEGHGCEWSVSVTSGVVQVQVICGNWLEPLDVYPVRGPTSTGPWEWRMSYHRVQAEHRWWGWRWFQDVQTKGSNTFFAVPLWVTAVALGACGAVLVRSARSRRAGTCAQCGYDVRGLAICPECGRGAG